MKENEMNILEILSGDSNISQRDIAKKTNMSLGMVNTLIKKCVKKGLIKIENLNARSVRYILTPKGIEEKAKKTLEYVSKSYRAILLINSYIKEVTQEQIKKRKKIIVVGSNDEMKEIIVHTLNDMGVSFEVYNDIEKIKDFNMKVIYIWENVYDEQLRYKSIENINLIK
ncbi:winged helix-turn-helix transcriptional regulator [Crassaminicella indica]|uniref:Winged helix-turn-helix transcriptional regulator n=1 Tax=Crassaminicella indica TaxID=2855394 RepID=A0ABX8RG61_9CLOT|nr:winged helix-turn-helix transcriptional regulator [Crassaminicella indica]QXM06685.1 winged helix-turn-helix transcriptional regulator [Crassaminicella indica]